jgi:hypothetical protein
MSTEEKFDEILWEIIQKIEEEILFQKRLKIVWKREKDSRDDFTYGKGEKRALARLEHLGVIKISTEPSYLFIEHFAGFAEAYLHQSLQDNNGRILYLTIFQPNFDEIYKEYEQKKDDQKNIVKSSKHINDKRLKSIWLITKDLISDTTLEPSAIFLVLDELFDMPVRFRTKNKKGNPTHIKKLYDIAYLANVPNKKVDYDKNISDGINNGLFKKKQIKKYIVTNNFKKPTLVQKSEKNTLVLKNEILVKIGLIRNDVPPQHKRLYIDKTQ